MNPKQDWWYIRELCHPNIAEKPWGEELYKTLVEVGKCRAHAWLAESRLPSNDADALRAAHRLIFQEVYPFAGELRGRGGELLGEASRGASPPARIAADIAQLNREAGQFLARASTESDFRRFVAGYHARLEEIQPFLDGNKRVALVVSAQHTKTLLKCSPSLALGRDHYVEDGLLAARRGNLGPLSYALTGEPLTGRHAEPPFTMTRSSIRASLQQDRQHRQERDLGHER